METKKWQIMRMYSGKQQTYNVKEKDWQISEDRWDDVFTATEEEAKRIFAKVKNNFRKVGHVSWPKLHEIS